MRTFGLFGFTFWCCSIILGSCVERTMDDASALYPVRLDLELSGIMDTLQADSVLNERAAAINLLFGIIGHDTDSITPTDIMQYANSKTIEIFSDAISKINPNIDSIAAVLGIVDSRMNNTIDASLGDIYTIVSPYRQWIFTNDSLMLVGLNHYLGPDFEGYSVFEEYYRHRKKLAYMPYDILEARIAALYAVDKTTGFSVMNALLYSGAVAMAKMKLIPDARLDMALGLENNDLEWGITNEKFIWGKLLENGLLFSTSEYDIQRLLGPGAGTPAITSEAPGAICRYIGYRMVESYLKQYPDTRLSFLLSPEFYKDKYVLEKIRYNPK